MEIYEGPQHKHYQEGELWQQDTHYLGGPQLQNVEKHGGWLGSLDQGTRQGGQVHFVTALLPRQNDHVQIKYIR